MNVIRENGSESGEFVIRKVRLHLVNRCRLIWLKICIFAVFTSSDVLYFYYRGKITNYKFLMESFYSGIGYYGTY